MKKSQVTCLLEFSQFYILICIDLRFCISQFTILRIMTPIPDASFYDDAESDGTSDELIVVDDE